MTVVIYLAAALFILGGVAAVVRYIKPWRIACHDEGRMSGEEKYMLLGLLSVACGAALLLFFA